MTDVFSLVSDGGVVTRFTHDGETVSLRDEQEVGDILRRCAASRDVEDKFMWNRRAAPFKPVMEIPMAVISSLKRRGIDLLNDDQALRVFINDPANKAFRLSTGRV